MSKTFPTISEICESIPSVNETFCPTFNDDSDETDYVNVRRLWGKKCHILTLDMALRLPFDTAIVATWGDHVCYHDNYGKKADLLTTIKFVSFKKVESNYVDIDVEMIDGYWASYTDKENFYVHSENLACPYVRCGGSAWPVYVFY
jgi:hypothetical protein